MTDALDLRSRLERLSPLQRERIAAQLGLPIPRRLVAFVVMRNDESFDDAKREALADRLPSAMIPGSVLTVDDLPRLPNGKVDMDALHTLADAAASTPASPSFEQISATQRALLSIWRDVLAFDEIGIHDNYFEIGGDSISTIHILSRARNEGLDFQPQDIVDHPTVSALAAVIDNSRAQAPAEGEPATAVNESSGSTAPGRYPLGAVQKALLLQTGDGAGPDVGFVQVGCRIEGDLDPGHVQSAWDTVFERHETLRASIAVDDGAMENQIVVHNGAAPKVQWIDLRSSPDKEQHRRLKAHHEHDRIDGLDLSIAPVARLAIFCLADRDYRLLWTCHHALLDGWSAWIVLREWAQIYQAQLEGRPNLLPPAASLQKFHEYVSSRDPEAEARFWTEQLRGLTTPTPVTKRPSLTTGEAYGVESVQLDSATTAKLDTLARQCRATPGALVSAAWALVIAKHASRRDVVLGTVVSGRPADLPGADSLVGMFINALPLRLELNPNASVRDTLALAHRAQQGLLGFQHSSLIDIQYRFSRVPGRHRLFDSLVVFQNFGRHAPEHGDAIRLSAFESGVNSTYPLTLSVEPSASAWQLDLAYGSQVLSSAEAKQWLDDFVDCLTGLPSAIDDPLHTIVPSLPAEDTTRFELTDSPARNSKLVAPRDDIEKKLVSIWTRELGVERISVDDNFFELGGQSLTAIRIFTEIERELECRVPIAALAHSPTIASIGDQIREQLSGRAPKVMFIPLSDRGTKPPVVLMPGVGGEALFWQHLDDWDHDRPVYTMGITSSEMPWSATATLPDIADFYAQAIAERLNGASAVHFVGYSFGGLLAFAVAERLRVAQHRVGTVVIIDTALERLPAPATVPLREQLPRFARNLARWMREEAEARDQQKWKDRLRRVWNTGRAKLGRTSRGPHNPLEGIYRAEDLPDQHLGRINDELRAADDYLPTPQPGRLVLLRARRQPLLQSRPWDFGWSQVVTGQVEVIEVPGNHENIVQPPHGREIARHLQRTLNQGDRYSERSVDHGPARNGTNTRPGEVRGTIS